MAGADSEAGWETTEVLRSPLGLVQTPASLLSVDAPPHPLRVHAQVLPCAPVPSGGSGTIAFAGACDYAGASLDRSNRPIVGTINYCQ